MNLNFLLQDMKFLHCCVCHSDDALACSKLHSAVVEEGERQRCDTKTRDRDMTPKHRPLTVHHPLSLPPPTSALAPCSLQPPFSLLSSPLPLCAIVSCAGHCAKLRSMAAAGETVASHPRCQLPRAAEQALRMEAPWKRSLHSLRARPRPRQLLWLHPQCKQSCLQNCLKRGCSTTQMDSPLFSGD